MRYSIERYVNREVNNFLDRVVIGTWEEFERRAIIPDENSEM